VERVNLFVEVASFTVKKKNCVSERRTGIVSIVLQRAGATSESWLYPQHGTTI
jgi:hypothetical protein